YRADFSHRRDGKPRRFYDIKKRLFRRVNRIILSRFCAAKIARLANEWPRNHAPDFILARQQPARDKTPFVKLIERRHLFVSGDLKNAVGGGVDDGPSGFDVFFAKLF